ncbi:hypothetical protein AB4037_25195 [Labrys sp. KB_33_2]|jgi:hypothetical protein|uniref:hypothetical protein n=1 Tax=unclassified Labrys (in: a-proteobacteria) TaxID=2688601 RepID=UPI003EBB7239
MLRLCTLFAPLAMLGACSTTPPKVETVTRGLERPLVACRTQQHVGTLHASGEKFQREFDNHMADGRCRRFTAGQKVRDRTKTSFVDPGNGVRYYIYQGG